jgi:hypothetical protein
VVYPVQHLVAVVRPPSNLCCYENPGMRRIGNHSLAETDALVRMLLQTQVCRGFICSVHRPLARKGLAINQISWFVNVSTPRVRFLMTANSRQLVSGSIYDTGRVMLTGVRRQNLRSRVNVPLIGLSYPPMTNRSRSLMERLG